MPSQYQVIQENSGEIQALDAATKCLIFGDSIGDASGKAVTAVGTAAVSTAQYKFAQLGRSILLDGNSDCLTLADSADWDFGSGNFTVDMYIKRVTSATDEYLIGVSNSNPDATSRAWGMYITSGNKIGAEFYYGGASSVRNTSSASIADTNWHHLAMVRNGNTATIYLNGVADGTVDLTGITLNDTSNLLAVGRLGEYGLYFNGNISCVRITKGTALWTSNFTPPVYSSYKGARTVYVLSGLNGDVDEEYELIARIVSGADSNAIGLRPNNDTGNNYGYQVLNGNNTIAAALRDTSEAMVNLDYYSGATNSIIMSKTIIHAKSGYVRTFITKTVENIVTTTVASITLIGNSWNNTADNITSLVFLANQTNGIGVGSRIILLKKSSTLDTTKTWEEIYTTTLTEAATSITIPSLTGNTDCLYRLRARIVNGYNGGSNSNISLRLNNDTADNYGTQTILGSDTTVSAYRNVNSQINLFESAFLANTPGTISMCNILIYSKSGYVRTVIGESNARINTTTITSISLTGGSWNNTADEITSIVLLGSQAGVLGVGTQISLEVLRGL